MQVDHAVLCVSPSIHPIVKCGFVPVERFDSSCTLNQLWLRNSNHGFDFYAHGDFRRFTVRQLRAHSFIFIGLKSDRFVLRDCTISPDIIIPKNACQNGTPKDIETIIGKQRLKLRRPFGCALRSYALERVTQLHGSEAETLMEADPVRHLVYGMPPVPPHLPGPGREVPYEGDEPTSPKLVSMLDYFVYEPSTCYYVGSGDGTSLKAFAKMDPRRFAWTKWVLIDPIAPAQGWAPNVETVQGIVSTPADLRALRRGGGTHILVWDVRTDRLPQHDDHDWEAIAMAEDDLGEAVARENKDWINRALLKRRIPRFSRAFWSYSSILLPQPSAPHDMFELRNYVNHDSKAPVERSHIPMAKMQCYDAYSAQRMVARFHTGLGKSLKRDLFAYLNIMRADGLLYAQHDSAHLFYLTNVCNIDKQSAVTEVLKRARIATAWIGPEDISGYGDWAFPRRLASLTLPDAQRALFTGLGFVLYLQRTGRVPVNLPFDPWWADQFLVAVQREKDMYPVPDVDLCRFIGLRHISSRMRLRFPGFHSYMDATKAVGIDASGHLYVSIASGAYILDIPRWIRMIMGWSQKDKAAKLKEIAEVNADIIEWKEDKADVPWHSFDDINAAMVSLRRLKLSDEERTGLESVQGLLHQLCFFN